MELSGWILKMYYRYKISFPSFIVIVLFFLGFVPSVHCAGTGLKGEYFNRTSTDGSYNQTPVSGTPDLVRIDPSVNFDWVFNSPDNNVTIYADDFQAKWSGYIYVPKNELWTFHTRSDDGVKLKINGISLISNWSIHAQTTNSSTPVNLDAGYHAVEMEFYERGGHAVAELYWSSASVLKQFIPQANLYPDVLPIADYHFDECGWNGTTGEVKDSSGNAYHGTSNNATSTDAGVLNNSVKFDGTNYITIANQSALEVGKDNADFSLSFWLYLDEGFTGQWRGIAHKGNNDSQRTFALWMQTDNNKIHYKISTTGNTNEGRDSVNQLSINQWHHIAYIKRGNKLELYINGVKDSEHSLGNDVLSNDGPIYIGKNPWHDGIKGNMDEFKIYEGALSSTMIETIFNNEKNLKNYDGTARDAVVCSTCQSLEDGYHVISPFGQVEKKFEVYCKDKKNYLMLPFYNAVAPNSNFLFTSNPVNNNYYHTENRGKKKEIKMLEVDFDIPNEQLILNQIIYEDASAGTTFSNLNLIGTPFAFVNPRNTSTIKECSADDTSKVRVGLDQAIKINPRASGYSRMCTIDRPKLRFLSDYKFLEFFGKEHLYTDCAKIASNISTSQLAEVTGSFYVDPKGAGRSNLNRDRPFVASCKYQEDLNQAWTFILALDGYTTTTKNDVINKQDTCSKLGLTFFTPNSKANFERVQYFLGELQSSQWGNYVGTVREYFDDNGITGWATNGATSVLKPDPIPNGLMWPYGPMGIYRPLDGAGGSNNKKMAKSTEYLSENEKSRGFGSMEEMGWQSLFYDYYNDLEKDLWWVADIAAGYNKNLDRIDALLEPSGDYNANNWLGWFTDSAGNIVHYNDQNGNNRYRYSNYMCMSFSNVDEIVRYEPVAGSFDVIEHGVASGTELVHRFITTKIVNKPINVDIVLLNKEETSLAPDNNVSVGIFLDEIEVVGGSEVPKDVKYFGDIKKNGTGTFNSLKASGRFALPVFSWQNAQKQMRFKFKHCNTSSDEWTDCWDVSGNNATCKASRTLDCNSTDSDVFVIRPASYTNVSLTGNKKAANPFTLTLNAAGDGGSISLGYDALVSVSKSLTDTSKTCAVSDGNLTKEDLTELSKVNFLDGDSSTQVRFNEVGAFTLNIKDAEWTDADQEKAPSQCIKDSNSTTSDPVGCNIENNVSFTVVPDHFDVNVSLKNFQGGAFTYLANPITDDIDRNMSAILDYNITARNALGRITQNYTNGCYAKETTHTLDFTPSMIANLNTIYAKELKSGFVISESIDGQMVNTLPLSIFDFNDINGTAKLSMKINFNRTNFKPVSPFDLNITKINVKDSDGVDGNGSSATMAQFYYGRIKTKDISTNKNTLGHTLHVEVYSTTPNVYVSGFHQNTLNWYINSLDDNVTTINDINLTAYKDFTKTTPSSLVSATNKSGLNAGKMDFNLTKGSSSDKQATFHLNIPTWLWYSSLGTKDYNASTTSNCAQHPCFEYRFINSDTNIGIKSGEFKGSTIGHDFNATYQKTGVKTFR